MHACMPSRFSHVWHCVTLCTVALQASLSMDSPGKNAGVSCYGHLQRIFLTQGSNLHLLYCRWILYHLSHQGRPKALCCPLYTKGITLTVKFSGQVWNNSGASTGYRERKQFWSSYGNSGPQIILHKGASWLQVEKAQGKNLRERKRLCIE